MVRIIVNDDFVWAALWYTAASQDKANGLKPQKSTFCVLVYDFSLCSLEFPLALPVFFKDMKVRY